MRCHRRRIGLLITLAGFLFAGPPVLAQVITGSSHTLHQTDGFVFPGTEPEAVGLSSETLRTLGNTVTRWSDEGIIMGAEILLIKDGKIVLHTSSGWQDQESHARLMRNGIFRMRSMTKPLIGTAILMLVEEGRMTLDDPVARYLPAFDHHGARTVTVYQLLTHTSGLGDHGSEDIGLPQRADAYTSLQALVDDIGKIGTTRPAGTYKYSDSGSATLGALIAQISGMPAEEFIETRILKPLGMNNTYTHFDPDSSWAGRMNSTYRWIEDSCAFERYWHPQMEQRYPYFRASGGVYSTVLDYARFVTMWMNKGIYDGKRFLTETTVEMALRSLANDTYGMHWSVPASPIVNGMPMVFGHGGSDGTMAYAFPAFNTIVLYFTQSRGRSNRRVFLTDLGRIPEFYPYVQYRWNDIEKVWHEVLNGSDRSHRSAVPAEQLMQYAGTYRHDAFVDEVIFSNDMLYHSIPECASPVLLHHVTETTFIGRYTCPCVDNIFTITFSLSEDGKVNQYKIESNYGWQGVFNRVE
ncbi:MAG: serine hydrolase [Saprospiraceae bacterium]|nr:serine hydrolase [Saprospiraceae bacterium]